VPRIQQLVQRLVQLPRARHGLAVPLDKIAQQIARTRPAQTGQRRTIEAIACNGRRGVELRQVVQ